MFKQRFVRRVLSSIVASGVKGVQPTVWVALKGAGSYTELYKPLCEYDLEVNREKITWT